MKNVWITKVNPCELLHFPPGWGHIVWTDDGPNIMTAPRDGIPKGMGALAVHLWFSICYWLYDGNNYNANKKYFRQNFRITKSYEPDPESPIPARVNAAVMGL